MNISDSEDEIMDILNLLAKSDVILDFGEQNQEIQGALSSQYVIDQVLNSKRKKVLEIVEENKSFEGIIY